jgi:heat shock protein HtpX
MIKRYGFMLVVNLLIMIVISLILSVLNIRPNGSMGGLLIFCFMFGMGGSFVSLFLSKWLAKRGMGLIEVDPHSSNGYLVDRVYEFAKMSNIQPPEVYIYESDELNAFATGPSKNNSLVAVSTGLLQSLSRDEVDGVLGHEVAHIANGDMVSMTLIQGVVNAFVMFLARLVAYAIDTALSSDDDEGGGLGYIGYFVVLNVLHAFFGFITLPIVASFSRYREYRADEGGARLAGKEKMISALEALERRFDITMLDQSEPSLKAMKISGGGVSELLSTHPPLSKRIKALQK